MDFIDHTGHIFSLESYNQIPYGYEFEARPYVFWLDEEYTNKLSINNYYMMPIRILLPDIFGINVNISMTESNVFRLISPKTIYDRLNEKEDAEKSIFDDYISISEDNDLKTSLTIPIKEISDEGYEQGHYVTIDGYNLVTFYVIGNADDEGTWITNLLININDEEWCPISVGGRFFNQYEELIINGKNMGVSLPKDIIRGVYQVSFDNAIFDESLYNDKLKEYLLNYMGIKGECGNFASAIKSLKWFGWGDKISISKLLKTDNQFIDQYIHDYFSINNDVIHAFETFKSTTLIALQLRENNELDEINWQDFNDDLWGEGKPKMEDLFKKQIIKHYDEGDIDFYRAYYDYCKSEMIYKLAALKYYYNKYFLPVHLNIHSGSIIHQCFTNDIKHISVGSNISLAEPAILNQYTDTTVVFPKNDTRFIYRQFHLVDHNYNEFNNIIDFDCYKLDDMCINIPISFMYRERQESEYYNCVLILVEKETGKQIYESHFNFYQDGFDETTWYKNFIIYPKQLNKNFDFNYWVNHAYTIYLMANGKWFKYDFTVKFPELYMRFGKLKYQYYINEYVDTTSMFTQLKSLSCGFNKVTDISTLENFDDLYFLYAPYNEFISIMSMPNTDSNDIVYKMDYAPVEDIFPSINYYVNVNDSYNIITYDELNTTYYRVYVRLTPQNYDPDNMYKHYEEGGFEHITGKPKYDDQTYFTGLYVTDYSGYDYRDGSTFYKVSSINTYIKHEDTPIYIYDYVIVDNPTVADIYSYYKKYNNEYVSLDYNVYKASDDNGVEFNAFMYQPDLVSANHIRYEIDLYKYMRDNAIQYFDEEWLSLIMENNIFCKFISYKNHRIFIYHNMSANNFVGYFEIYVNLSLFDKDIDYVLSLNKIDNKNVVDYYIYELHDTIYTEIKHDTTVITLNITTTPPPPQPANNKLGIGFSIVDGVFTYLLTDNNGSIVTPGSQMLYKNLNDFINMYAEDVNVSNKDKYLNRVHIFDLYKKNDKGEYEKLNYEKEDDEQIYNKHLAKLYAEFFNYDLTPKIELDNRFKYDMYLMHDDNVWFIVFISKDTIDRVYSKTLLEVHDDIEFNNYLLKFNRSDNKFLLNRMNYVEVEDNEFDYDDIIISRLINFSGLSVDLNQSTQWKITPYSIGILNGSNVYAKPSMAIISFDKKNGGNQTGYYNVDVDYCIDNFNQAHYYKHARIHVK